MTKQILYEIKKGKAVIKKTTDMREDIDLEDSNFFKVIQKNLEFTVGYRKGIKFVYIWAGSYGVEVPENDLKLILETIQGDECDNKLIAREI